MPTSKPTARDVHVDSLLTDFAVAYGQDLRAEFVADRAFTPARVQKQSDKYVVWDKGDWYRSQMQLRADGAKSAGGGFAIDTSNSYFCETYALHTFLTDRQRKNADQQIDLEQAKVRWLMGQAKLKQDELWAASAFVTGVWTGVTEQTGVSSSPSTNEFLQWNDASSTPIIDIIEQINAVYVATGKKPNVAVTSPEVLIQLQNHADFLDRVKYTSGPAIVTADLVAQVLGLEEVIIGGAVKNTAAEGQTASMSRVFGKNFLLLHRTPVLTDEEPTAGVSFHWDEIDMVTADGASIRQWYVDDRMATQFEAQMSYVPKITATDLGVMMLSAVA